MTSDPFLLLGLPPRFALEPAELDRRWRERARALHPDRVPPAERARAEAQTIALNDARRVLADWVERALWLLGRPELPRVVDPAFLEAQLALRERLAAGVDAESIAAEARAALATLEREVAALFAGEPVGRAAVLERVAKARFWRAVAKEAGKTSPR